jgi:DNA-nicking Smr family endonuclease
MQDPVELPIEDSLDLHPFPPREIPGLVQEYLYQAVQRGFREVRLIHGKGIGVQRRMVHSILADHPHVVAFRDAADRGSTTVTLVENSTFPSL